MIDKIVLNINIADCPAMVEDMRVLAHDAIANAGGTPEYKKSKRTGVESVQGGIGGMYIRANAGNIRVSGSLPRYYYRGYGVLAISDYRDAIRRLSDTLCLPIDALKSAKVTELEVHRDVELPMGCSYSSFEGRIYEIKGLKLQRWEKGTRYYISERAKQDNWAKQGKRLRIYDKRKELKEVQGIDLGRELMRVEITLKSAKLRGCGISTARDIGMKKRWTCLYALIDEVKITLKDDAMNDVQIRELAKRATTELEMLAITKLAGGYGEAKQLIKTIFEEGHITRNTYYKKRGLLERAISSEQNELAKTDPILQTLRNAKLA